MGIPRKGAALRGLDAWNPDGKVSIAEQGGEPLFSNLWSVRSASPSPLKARRDPQFSMESVGTLKSPLPGIGQGPKVGCAPARRSLRADVNAPAIKALRTARNSGAFPANHRVRSRGIQASARNSGERGEKT